MNSRLREESLEAEDSATRSRIRAGRFIVTIVTNADRDSAQQPETAIAENEHCKTRVGSWSENVSDFRLPFKQPSRTNDADKIQKWSKPFEKTMSVSMCTIKADNCLFLCSCLCHLVVECGIHGQQNTNTANLQWCCCSEAETGFVPTSAQFFAASTFLILRSPFLNSFLYPKVPRVNVFRSISCSPSIRQRIRRRTVTLYFNLHWNSQILVHRSQG